MSLLHHQTLHAGREVAVVAVSELMLLVLVGYVVL